jgi:hypothetical protein
MRLLSRTAIVSLIDHLDYINRNKVITDDEWSEWVRIAHRKEEDEPFNLSGHWWILVLGDRDPITVKRILKNYLSSVGPPIKGEDIPVIKDYKPGAFSKHEEMIPISVENSFERPISSKKTEYQSIFDEVYEKREGIEIIRKPNIKQKSRTGEVFKGPYRGTQYKVMSNGKVFKNKDDGWIEIKPRNKDFVMTFMKYKKGGGKFRINQKGEILFKLLNEKTYEWETIYFGKASNFGLD